MWACTMSWQVAWEPGERNGRRLWGPSLREPCAQASLDDPLEDGSPSPAGTYRRRLGPSRLRFGATTCSVPVCGSRRTMPTGTSRAIRRLAAGVVSRGEAGAAELICFPKLGELHEADLARRRAVWTCSHRHRAERSSRAPQSVAEHCGAESS